MEEYNTPKLIENGVKVFISHNLNKCNQFKQKYYNTMINIGIFIVFVVIIVIILCMQYKGKMTPEELEEKERQKEQYIMSKIKNYQQDKLMAQQKLITGLPHWETEYDIIHKKKNI